MTHLGGSIAIIIYRSVLGSGSIVWVTVSKLVLTAETVAVDVGVGESYVIVRVVACPFDDVVIVVNHSGADGSSGVATAEKQASEHMVKRGSRRSTYCLQHKPPGGQGQ